MSGSQLTGIVALPHRYTHNEKLDIEEADENGFIDGAVDVDNAIMSFSFAPASHSPAQPAAAFQGISSSFGKMSFNGCTRGATPQIDGEAFAATRCYKYRLSTLRKLNELKAKHSDVIVYLSTIIDEAITHYYEHVFHRS